MANEKQQSPSQMEPSIVRNYYTGFRERPLSQREEWDESSVETCIEPNHECIRGDSVVLIHMSELAGPGYCLAGEGAKENR